MLEWPQESFGIVSRTIWRWTAAILGFVALLIAAEFALRLRYRRYVMPRARPAPGQVTLVALGDSIVAGWPYGLDRLGRRSWRNGCALLILTCSGA